MESTLTTAEEIDELWTMVLDQHEEQQQNARFKSIFNINGGPILPPLMTPDRRQEMQQYRQAAMAIEEQLAQSKIPSQTKILPGTAPESSQLPDIDPDGRQLPDIAPESTLLSDNVPDGSLRTDIGPESSPILDISTESILLPDIDPDGKLVTDIAPERSLLPDITTESTLILHTDPVSSCPDINSESNLDIVSYLASKSGLRLKINPDNSLLLDITTDSTHLTDVEPENTLLTDNDPDGSLRTDIVPDISTESSLLLGITINSSLPLDIDPESSALEQAINDCCKLVDSSTNTELDSQLLQPSLTVAGRMKQLKLSDTLIYDNTTGTITNLRKTRSKSNLSVQPPPLLEECLELGAQHVVVEEAPQKYDTLSEFTLKTAEKEPNSSSLQSQLQVDKSLELIAKPKQKEKSKSIKTNATLPKDLAAGRLSIGAKHLLKGNIFQTQGEQLQRSTTSPSLIPKAEAMKFNYYTDRKERLHSQLWKRCHSYQFDATTAANRAAPSSPNTKTAAGFFPQINVARPCTVSSSSKIQVKQRMAPVQQHPTLESTKSKIHCSTLPKLTSARANQKRTSSANNGVRYEAHASSHANVQLASSDSQSKMSSTQRRLNYDPRATLKRSVATKRDGATGIPRKNNSARQTLPKAPTSAFTSGDNLKLLKPKLMQDVKPNMLLDVKPKLLLDVKPKLLQDVKLQQRQRFQVLVMEQANEQQRMQTEFQAQQQLLMDQLLSDMNSISIDKNVGALDPTSSESSSIASLPQSRQELNNDEPEPSL